MCSVNLDLEQQQHMMLPLLLLDAAGVNSYTRTSLFPSSFKSSENVVGVDVQLVG
jgi:hypothetical protein